MARPSIDQVIATKCPVCGSEEKAGLDFIEEMKKNGWLPSQMNVDECLSLQIPFLSSINAPGNLTQELPALFIHFAVCGAEDCGAMYVTRVRSSFEKLPPELLGRRGRA